MPAARLELWNALAEGHDSWLVSLYGQDWLRAFGWLTVWGSVALTVAEDAACPVAVTHPGIRCD